MRPKAVVFDLGKVLVDFDFSIAARRIAARSRLDAAKVQGLIDQSPLLARYESGKIDAREFFREVQTLTGFAGGFDDFAIAFADIFAPLDEMIALHGRLQKGGHPTYIFSNTNDLAVGHIRKQYPFFAHFNGYVFSFEHGAMKPQAALYEVVEQMCGLRGSDILYIDDRLDNVEAGRARGWQVIQHREPAETIKVVEGHFF